MVQLNHGPHPAYAPRVVLRPKKKQKKNTEAQGAHNVTVFLTILKILVKRFNYFSSKELSITGFGQFGCAHCAEHCARRSIS